MLDNFLPEGPIVRVEKKPAELEGFVSEFAFEPPPAPPPVNTTTAPRWRQSGSSTTVVCAGCLCCALTIGAVAMPLRSRPVAQEVREVRHLGVFAAPTPVLIPAKPAGQPQRPNTPNATAAARTTMAASVRTAKTVTPAPTRAIAARAVNNTAPDREAPRAPVNRFVAAPTPIAVSEVVAIAAPAAPIAPPAAAVSLEAVGVAAVVRWVSEEAAVRNVLELYRGAYQELDAEAARRIWPNLDERRLAKAFSDLESQRLDFDDCRIDIDNGRSVARCRGRATYVGRVGKRTPQTQERSWTFQLHKTGERWAIDSVRSQ